jgi:hypothetical protein
VRVLLYSLLVFAGLRAAAYAQVDAKALVHQSIQNYQRDWREARMSLIYTQTDTTTADGTKETEISEIIPLCGTPYERLIRKDGRALAPAEQRKEDHKFQRTEHERRSETPSEREARIRKYENERAFVNDIPEAYNFKLVGEEKVEGRPAWVVTMTPRAGFVPTAPRGSMLEHIEGRLWIDKEDVQWAKAEAHVIDTIGIGWILARVEPGTRFTVEQTRVESGLWMPRRITINGAAHVMLIHSKSLNEELTYSGYRRDTSTSASSKENAPISRPAPANAEKALRRNLSANAFTGSHSPATCE